LIQLSLNAAWNCATTGPSTRKWMSRQWSLSCALPCQGSPMPTPPVKADAPVDDQHLALRAVW
jgi:hypothetical protein